MICNKHNTNEQKPMDATEFEARRVREAISGNSMQEHTDLEIFVDILNSKHVQMKREEIISEFAAREHCTTNAAGELFDRNRKYLLENDHIMQPDHGYYIYIDIKR